ncbi:methyl viologen resistance protein SmvA [Klebsiella variicola]|nr:methyl viologen resistance protein SmvA [Klebsiella variicola]
MAQQASSSIGEAVSLTEALPAGMAEALMAAAKAAFTQAHSLVLATAGVLLLLLAAGIWRSLASVAKPQSTL